MDTGRLNDVTKEEWDSTRCYRYAEINWTAHQEEEAHLADRAFNGASASRDAYVGVEQEPWSGFFKGRSSAKFVPMTPEEADAEFITTTFGPLETAPDGSGNPKARVGALKAPLHLVPPVATIQMSLALSDGAAKYGPFNWRDEPINVSTYIAAVARHMAAYQDGEDIASDSGVHHLSHAMTCCALLLDSEALGILIDDRPTHGSAARLLDELHRRQEK